MGADPAEAASHGIQKRVNQSYLAIIRSLDWAKFTAKVEFKHVKGLFARGRLFTISGSGGTLYPPLKVGDVVKVTVTGHDLTQLMESRQTKRVTNPYFYDKSDVAIDLSGYMETGEPAGRKAATPPAAGEWLLVHETGAEIRITANGDIVVKPAANRGIYLGGVNTPKGVLVDGDSNSGGAISASQSRVFVGQA